MNRITVLWRRISMGAMAAALILGAHGAPAPAAGLCAQPRAAGAWRNANPATRGITRLDVRFVCNDVSHNGTPPGPSWFVRLFGACHPVDCAWGERPAAETKGGWIYAVYRQPFARRYVWLRVSDSEPGRLRLVVRTDFIDPERPDYALDEWFVRP